MSTFINGIKHFYRITKHKYYVFYYCRKFGLIWQGLTHDMSKYSPTEFLESVKYYDNSKSPIVVCKEHNGYSNAWFHHKGRNKHHYEYWIDSVDNGGIPVKMPLCYAIELVCDYLGAGRTYNNNGRSFTYAQEYDWWIHHKLPTHPAMHPHTMEFVTVMLNALTRFSDKQVLTYEYAKFAYKNAHKLCESQKLLNGVYDYE